MAAGRFAAGLASKRQVIIVNSEMDLLLACCRFAPGEKHTAAIRRALQDGIDWPGFARAAVEHGIAPFAGHNLACIAPELVPEDILDAFRAIIHHTKKTNEVLVGELARVVDVLETNRIAAIVIIGPGFAVDAYGDAGLSSTRQLDLLIRPRDYAAARTKLHELGYHGNQQTNGAQSRHDLPAGRVLFEEKTGAAVALNTQLIPDDVSLSIDYAGMWGRARPTVSNGRTILLLEPEDMLIALALRGGMDLWQNLKPVCDVAAFIHSRPALDWRTVAERARLQSCRRLVMIAQLLVRDHFNAATPAGPECDAEIEHMTARISEVWQGAETRNMSSPAFQLHELMDGSAGKPSRVLHIFRSPRRWPERMLRPFERAWLQAVKHSEHLRDILARSEIGLALLPMPASEKMIIRQHHASRAAAKRVLAADPNNAAAWNSLGDALSALKQYPQSIACYDRALAFSPGNIFILRKRSKLLAATGEDAECLYPPELDVASSWTAYATRLFSAKRFAEASAASDHALELDPLNAAAARTGIQSRLHACDWRNRDDDMQRITRGIDAGRNVITPYLHRAISDSESEFLALARILSSGQGFPKLAALPDRSAPRTGCKIRVGYLSVESHDATTHMIAGVFEHHNRSRFETTAIAIGPDDESEMRRRIRDSFDRFVSVHGINDDDALTRLRSLQLDILIDLKGNAGDRRTGILARRAAPVQVNYLGYPGTMGVPFIDYIIADPIIVPRESHDYYTENIVYLPNSYMATDNSRPISTETPSRAAEELPEAGFIFASFNYNYKISPEVFAVWMRLLHSVEGSVLWLRSTNPDARSSLRREARMLGIAPERIVFAPFAPRAEDYFARLRLAGLFLDTLPFNAHATAVDALWAGLPVLTCTGSTFAGRVAGSLLCAAGLPELVTHSLEDYEKLALALAQNPERLAAIRMKLMRNRDTHPIFDTAKFTRSLERAYTIMFERQQSGLVPESFAVDERAE